MKISIANADKAEVLAALFNASKQQGMGFLDRSGRDRMTKEEAQKQIEAGGDRMRGLYFDYLRGRVMKVELSKPEMEVWLYDRDNGPGAAWNAVKDIIGVELIPDPVEAV